MVGDEAIGGGWCDGVTSLLAGRDTEGERQMIIRECVYCVIVQAITSLIVVDDEVVWLFLQPGCPKWMVLVVK